MNNKSFYATIAFVAIIDLICIIHPIANALLITRALLCGAALYYIVKVIKEGKKLHLFYFPMMVVFAVLFNPIVRINLPEGLQLLLDILALCVFYFLSRSQSLPGGITHKEIFPDEEGVDDSSGIEKTAPKHQPTDEEEDED